MAKSSEFVGYQRLLEDLIELLPFPIYWKDRQSRYVGCNTSFAQYAGWGKPDEVKDKTDFDMRWQDVADVLRAEDEFVMENGAQKKAREEPEVAPDGSVAWMRTAKIPLRDHRKRVIGVLGFYHDVTELAHAREAEAAIARAFAVFSKCTALLISSETERDLLSGICKILVEEGGYQMSCVELQEYGRASSPARSAWAELDADQGYAAQAAFETGRVGSSAASQEGAPEDVWCHPKMPFWDARALTRGFRLRIAIPLICKTKVLGTITAYSDRSWPSLEQETRLLSEIAGHVACRVCSLRTSAEGATC